MPIQSRRDLNNRISFYDPSNQGTLDRLLSGDVVLQLEKEGDDAEGDAQLENAQATLTSVEEMLEGYEMTSDDILGGKTLRGTADQIEARLLDELMALEKVTCSASRPPGERANTSHVGQYPFVHRSGR